MVCASLFAQDTAKTEANLLGDGPLDLTRFPAQVVDGVIVPVPSEVFGVLDKLGESEWASVVIKRKAFTDKSRRRTALALGVSVADGLLAVQAQDAAAVENAGRDVLSLAASLGLRQTVAEHCQSIFEAAGKREWNAVRLELDRTQKTVRDTMEKMRDEALADLVSLGGWVRGTEALTELISNAYTTDKAELVQQPDLVSFFQKSLTKHPKEGADAALLAEVSKGLTTISGAMGESDVGVNSTAILDIQEASARVVAIILKTVKETAVVADEE